MIRKLLLLTLVMINAGCAGVSQGIEAHKSKERAAMSEMLEARQNTEVISCNGKEQCDRYFRVASDFAMEHATMKIQTATENYVATFNPISDGQVGITARRMLGTAGSETIKLDINCNPGRYGLLTISCYSQTATMYKLYGIQIKNQSYR